MLAGAIALIALEFDRRGGAVERASAAAKGLERREQRGEVAGDRIKARNDRDDLALFAFFEIDDRRLRRGKQDSAGGIARARAIGQRLPARFARDGLLKRGSSEESGHGMMRDEGSGIWEQEGAKRCHGVRPK